MTVLVVAATPRELAVADGWRTLCCGVGPVEAAAATAQALAAEPPSVVLHVGIAGSRTPALRPPALVIGTEAVYADLDPANAFAPRVVTAPAALVAAARAALPGATPCPIGTSARVGGVPAGAVEAMEGFAVLRAAERAGVPALEVRAISNDVGEPDRARWRFDEAFAAITAATPALVAALRRCGR